MPEKKFTITTENVIILINTLLGTAFLIYNSIEQVEGNIPIPSWDELVDRNKLSQDKIDAEANP